MKNKVLIIIIIILTFALGATWSYMIIRQLGDSNSSISQVMKNYTINENSISGAVDKIYDATVTVITLSGETQVSSGTGFVYKVDGGTAYIMTNNHVISSGNSAKVLFSDGTEAETIILGGDAYADIAVLTTSAKNIKQVATIGNTESMKLGDTTFAVGAPMGNTYSGTVTKGILSGKDRLVAVSLSGTTSDYYMKVLQTDAALNPGNSGGPLCNINGEVIGVTSLKLTQEKISTTSTYNVEGMGFAIPIEDAIYYAEIIETNKSVKRPYIGISMIDITDSYYLWQAGVTIPDGVKNGVAILEVVSSSPADKAGLKKGDIITKLEKETIKSVAELRYELYKHNPEETITITYNRDGKEYSAPITLEESK